MRTNYLIIRDGQLWRDVDERLRNQARLIGLDQRVPRDNGRRVLDVAQDVNALQAWLHRQHRPHRDAAYLTTYVGQGTESAHADPQTCPNDVN